MKDVPKVRITIHVPDQGTHRVRRRSAPQEHVRDWVASAIRQNLSAVQATYGVMPRVTHRENDQIVIEVPVPSISDLSGESLQRLLFQGVQNKYQIVSVEGPENEHRASAGGISPDILVQLSQYRRLGTPDELEHRLTQSADELARLGAEVAALGEQKRRLYEERRHPSEFGFDELVVLMARHLLGPSYAKCCDQYDKLYPGGLDDETRRALENEPKDYVLTEEIIRLCDASEAGIHIHQSLEDLLVEAKLRSEPFEHSPGYSGDLISYVGAVAILQKADVGSEEVSKELIEDCLDVRKTFEDNQKRWEEKRAVASQVFTLLQERKELYEIARSIAPDKRLDITVPVMMVYHVQPDQSEVCFALPCNQQTSNRNLTRALQWDVAHSLRKAIREWEYVGLVERVALGSTLYGARMQGNQKQLRPEEVVRSMKENYAGRALSKIGVNILVHQYGEVK